jgi:oligopeptide transport system permease protein
MQQKLSDRFKLLDRKTVEALSVERPSLTYWQDVFRRLRNNKVSMISLGAIVFIFLLAIFGPMFISYSYSDQIRGAESLGPSWKHIMGTDHLGRDMFVRILYGARVSLSVGVFATIVNWTIGVIYGGIAGYIGGKVDMIMMRIIDILISIPLLLYVILLSVILKPRLTELFKIPMFHGLQAAGAGLISMYIAIGIAYWVTTARIMRGQILSLKEHEYVTAARALGASNSRILLRHLIPNCIGPIIVTTMLLIPDAIFTESFLSFIGLGVDAPMASLGSLAADAVGGIRSYFYLLLFPSLTISITILVFNMFGDGLRNALDPRMRK